MRPTRAPFCARAIARLTDVVDLPTPPLPAPTAMMLRMPGTCWRPKPPRVLTLAVIFARAAATPGRAATSASACAFIWSFTGQAGVVSSIVKSTSPPLISTSFTKPRVTMSLWRSGSCTLRRAESTSSFVTFTVFTSERGASGRQGLVDGLLQLLELRRRAAEHLREDPALAVEHERGGVALVRPEVLARLLVADELAVGDLVLADEVDDLLGGARVHHDPDHLDPAGLVLPVELRVLGDLLDAGPAPGGPEVHHDHLALEGGEARPAAIEVGE